MPDTSGDYSVQIRGIQEAQAANLRMIAAVQPPNALGAGVKRALTMLHRYAVRVTHVDTGALRASHVMDLMLRAREAVGRLYISRKTVNPKHGERPYRYGIEEHERGGSHAFYERTFKEEGPDAALAALLALRKGVDKAAAHRGVKGLFERL